MSFLNSTGWKSCAAWGRAHFVKGGETACGLALREGRRLTRAAKAQDKCPSCDAEVAMAVAPAGVPTAAPAATRILSSHLGCDVCGVVVGRHVFDVGTPHSWGCRGAGTWRELSLVVPQRAGEAVPVAPAPPTSFVCQSCASRPCVCAPATGLLSPDHLEHTLKNIGNPMTNGGLLRQHIAAQAATITQLREALAQQKEMTKRAVDGAAQLLAAVNEVLGYVHMHSADMGGNHRYTLMRGHGPAVARLQHIAAQQTEKKP